MRSNLWLRAFQASEMAVLGGALCGACMGFLWYNAFPAHVFMGDSGSLPPGGALATTMEMLNAYGIIGVASYFLPLLNLIITLSAIVGMSGLLGGNTSLEGLSRFV